MHLCDESIRVLRCIGGGDSERHFPFVRRAASVQLLFVVVDVIVTFLAPTTPGTTGSSPPLPNSQKVQRKNILFPWEKASTWQRTLQKLKPNRKPWPPPGGGCSGGSGGEFGFRDDTFSSRKQEEKASGNKRSLPHRKRTNPSTTNPSCAELVLKQDAPFVRFERHFTVSQRSSCTDARN